MYVKEDADILFQTCPPTRSKLSGASMPQPAGRRSSCSHPAHPGDAVAEARCRARLQDRHLSHRHALAVGRRHECGLAALRAGEAEATSAIPPPELRKILGYPDYDVQGKPFVVPR